MAAFLINKKRTQLLFEFKMYTYWFLFAISFDLKLNFQMHVKFIR